MNKFLYLLSIITSIYVKMDCSCSYYVKIMSGCGVFNMFLFILLHSFQCDKTTIMKKLLLFIGCISSFVCLQAQIGVNTATPQVSLDIHAASIDGTTAEGLSAPRLTLSELTLKDSKYTSDQIGAMVYVADVSGSASVKTKNVISVGYYYYDGTLWQTLGPDQSLHFLYMPAVVLPTNTSDPSYNSATQTFTVNLYANYSAQFGMSASGSSVKSPGATALPVLSADALEYLIVYYDNTVYQNVAVSNVGVLTYKLPAVVTVTDKTFMNILLKVKR